MDSDLWFVFGPTMILGIPGRGLQNENGVFTLIKSGRESENDIHTVTIGTMLNNNTAFLLTG